MDSQFEIHLSVAVKRVQTTSTELMTEEEIVDIVMVQETVQSFLIKLRSIFACRHTSYIDDAIDIVLLKKSQKLFLRVAGVSYGVQSIFLVYFRHKPHYFYCKITVFSSNCDIKRNFLAVFVNLCLFLQQKR